MRIFKTANLLFFLVTAPAVLVLNACNNNEFDTTTKTTSTPKSQTTTSPATPEANVEVGDPAGIDPGDISRSLSFADSEGYLHVGDGVWGNGGGNAHCQSDLKVSKLLGSTYRLEFEVLLDNTEVKFNIDMVCGLDTTKNWIGIDQLPSDSVPVAADRIALNEVREGLGQTLVFSRTLKAGKHFMSINSAIIDGSSNHDDLMIGKILINADKAIKRGEIQAQK